MNILLYIVSIWNLCVLLLYGLDKHKSIHKRRRIRESTLLSCAFFMGGVGAIFGMVLFQHKTAKRKFTLLVPLSILVNILLTVSFLYVKKTYF